MSSREVQLRAYCYLDRLQPRYAAFLGTVIQGDIPVQGMAALFVEVAPGNEVFRLVDVALKSSKVQPGAQVVEREFGLFEIHSMSQAAVQSAGQAVLAELGLSEQDRLLPSLTSLQRINAINTYQGQLLNRFRRGSTLVAGQTLLVVECTPAAYANYLANQAEKRANIDILQVSGLGRFGRIWLSGSETETLTAQQAILDAVATLQQLAVRPNPRSIKADKIMEQQL